MSELRKDPFLERWVIIAEERGQRPTTIQAADTAADRSTCPFCAGNEAETEPEIFAVRDADTAPNGPGWQVRVVPNRYPALRPDAPDVAAVEENELLQRQPGVGHHEVIIEGPHTRSVSEIPTPEFAEVVGVYRERYRTLAKDDTLRSAVLIKNVGAAAGASIEHSHSQLIATPVLPMLLQRELVTAAEWSKRHESCLWCSWLATEQTAGSRVVARNDYVTVLCPYAPRFPYETWLLPTQHASHFEHADDACVEVLAEMLHRSVTAIERCLGEPAYNYVVHSAPLGESTRSDYHWRMEVLPRVTRVAGYEQATGFYINPLSPERSAQELRAVF
ncbi:MAG: DUF4921 family protein [Planctomycetota bacterium]